MHKSTSLPSIKVVLGFAVLPQRYVGLEEALNLLGESLNEIAADTDIFSRKTLESLVLSFSIIEKDSPPELGLNYAGRNRKNPLIRLSISHPKLLRISGDARSVASHLFPYGASGLRYAATKFRLPALEKKLQNVGHNYEFQRTPDGAADRQRWAFEE
jgi:hypothetical protein